MMKYLTKSVSTPRWLLWLLWADVTLHATGYYLDLLITYLRAHTP